MTENIRTKADFIEYISTQDPTPERVELACYSYVNHSSFSEGRVSEPAALHDNWVLVDSLSGSVDLTTLSAALASLKFMVGFSPDLTPAGRQHSEIFVEAMY